MRFNYFSILGFVIAIFLFIGMSNNAAAQIKIGTNGSTIEPSSLLELESNNQGLLLPRLTDTIAINTLNPPNGMLIYLTKWPAVGLYVRKATGWEYLTGSLGGNGNFNNLTVGGTLIAQNFTGNLIGNASTATLATTATNAVNVNITNDLSTSTVSYPTFVTNTPGSTSIRTSSSKLSFVPNTGILTAVGFKGNLVGDVTGVATSAIDAVNAAKIQIVEDDVNNNPVYPIFVTEKVGPTIATINSAKLQYLPSTGELTAPIFKGELKGNATSTTTATNAANVAISDDSANSLPTYPVFVNALTGNQALKSTSTFLSYVPATGILTAKGFVGNLVGDVTGQASSAVNANNANNALNATNTVNSAITDDNSSTNKFYPTFVGTTSGNQPLKSSSANLSYVPSTGILTAKGFVGNLVGDVTGKVSNAQQADNSSNIEVAEVVPGVPTYYPTLVSATAGPTSIKVNNSQLKYLPSQGELISPKFRGELIGNASSTTTATNAANVAITDDVTNPLTTYPVFVNSPTGNQSVKSSSTNLSYVPSTGILTAKGFVGNLVGNVTGSVSNSQSADNAAKISVTTDDITASTVYPVFVSGTSGSMQPNVSTGRLGFKPLTGELSAPIFRGELIGNAATATSSISATNSTNSAVADENSSANTFYPVFVGNTSGNQPIKTGSNSLKYVPSTGILSATGFAGPLVGNVTGQATSALSAVSATNVAVSTNDLESLTMYPTFVSGITGSLPISVHSSKLGFKPSIGELSATTFKGNLDGNAASATTAVTADNALKSVIIDDASHSSETFPLFVNDAAGNQPLRSNRTNLSYLPSSGTLKAKEFVGKLTGNVNGIATNAIDATNSANIAITDDLASNSFKPLTFVDGNSGNLPLKVSSSKLRYNPSTGELISGSFNGNLIGNASTATTISPAGLVLPVNGGTGQTTYAAGDILYAESASTLKKLPIGPFGSVLRVEQPGGAGTALVPSWATTGPGTITEVQYGGTGLSSITAGGVLIGNGSNTITTVSGSVGQVLRSNGPGVPPSFQNAAGGDMILAGDQVVTGPKTFGTPGVGGFGGSNNVLRLAGTKLGFTILNGPDIGGGTVELPQSGTLVTLKGIETLENKTLTSPKLITPTIGDAEGASLILNSGQKLTTTNQTGTGDIVMSTGAQLVSPNIGDASGSSLNVGGGTITAGTFVGTLNGNVSGNANNVSGIVQITNGGTGANTKQAGFDNLSPMTSPGDMIYGGTLGSANRLPIGGANQVLKGGLTAPAWGSVNLTTDVSQVLPTQNGGTGNAFTEFTGPFTTKKIFTLPNFNADLAITSGSQIFKGTQTFENTIAGNIESANNATKLAAPKNINGVAFDGSADITIPASASTLLGTTLNPSILNSSLTSVGTLTKLTVTNPINGDITGNAATATTATNVITNANLTGEVTSIGNATTISNNAVISKVLTGYSSSAGVVTASDNIVNAISKLSGNIAANANATHTGDVTGSTALTIANSAVTSSKIANSAVTLDKIQDISTNTVLGRTTGGTGLVEEIATTGTGNVVRATSPTLVTPNLGAASASSLNVSGLLKSTIADGNAPFEVLSSTPVANLSIGGNAGSATKLATPRAINGVNFDGTGPITITASAATLTGSVLSSSVTSSSLTSVGTLSNLEVTNPIVGSVTGTADNVTGTVAITNGGTGATNRQSALNALAGTQFSGRFLRSDGINTTLSNIQAGDVPTLNQNTTGTSAGLADAYIDWNATSGGRAILNKPTINAGTVTSVSALSLSSVGSDISSSVANSSSTPTITLNVPNASATSRGALTAADWSTFNAKQSPLTFSNGLTNSSGTVTVNTTQNITNLSNLSSNGIVSTSGGTGTLGVTPVNGTGNVVLTDGANLTNPNIGTATGTSLSLTGSLTSTATTGTPPFIVSSTTPVSNLNIGGNAATATKLATARTINGISFDGSADVTVPAASLSAPYIDWNAASGGASILNKPTITDGTVKSVSATVPSFLTVTGSPITSTGTLAINYNTGTALPVANGGTGLISLTSGGALYASSSNSIATGTLPATAGGTGINNYLVGDILYASTATALSRLPSAAVGNALISNGVGVAPSWGKIDLSTHVQGTIPISLGGTGSSTQNFVDISTNQTIQGVKIFAEQITGNISGNAGGNAATATKLVNSRTIYGNAFDGSANLDQVIAPAFGGTGNAFTRFVGPSVSVKTYTLPTANATLARTDAAQVFDGVQTFNETIVGSINGNAATATIASGLVSGATITNPTLVTPTLGTATATSINNVTITAPATSATLNLANGSTLATSGANSITLTSTGATNVTLPTSGTLVSAISASGELNFGSVAAGESTVLTITGVTGAVDGDVISMGVPNALASAGGIYTAWVSANDTISVKFTNTTTSTVIDPVSGTFKFKILK